MNNLRLNNRNFKQLEKNIKFHSLQEYKYACAFIVSHNGKNHRKKRDYVLFLWGNNAPTKIYKESIEAKKNKCYRPDFFLIKCEDNQFKASPITTFPLEVTTFKDIAKRYFVKQSKIIWDYDKETRLVTTNSNYILIIINTGNPGFEKYTLLKPSFIKKLGERRLVHKYNGIVPGYHFNHNERDWKDLYPAFVMKFQQQDIFTKKKILGGNY